MIDDSTRSSTYLKMFVPIIKTLFIPTQVEEKRLKFNIN